MFKMIQSLTQHHQQAYIVLLPLLKINVI